MKVNARKQTVNKVCVIYKYTYITLSKHTTVLPHEKLAKKHKTILGVSAPIVYINVCVMWLS